jgi:hypothetical protein
MKLNNGKMSVHLEISEDAYWALTRIAAEDQMHIEEWLETYLDEHCSDPRPLRLQVLESRDLRAGGAYVARLLINNDGLDLVGLCNIISQISDQLDTVQGIQTVELGHPKG